MTPEDDKACRKCRMQFGNHFTFTAMIVAMILLLRWMGSLVQERIQPWMP